MTKRKPRRHVPLYKMTSMPVTSLAPGASAKDISAFAKVANRNSPATFLRDRVVLIERQAKRIAARRRVPPDLRLHAWRCLDCIQHVRHFLGLSALTGEGIAAAMEAALTLGDEWQSLIVAAQLGPIVADKLAMTDAGTRNVLSHNKRTKEAADADALNVFHGWRRNRLDVLTGLDAAACLKRFTSTMRPAKRLSDRLHRLLRDGQIVVTG